METLPFNAHSIIALFIFYFLSNISNITRVVKAKFLFFRKARK